MSHNNGSTERRTALVTGAGGDISRGIACALRMTVSTWRWPPYPACASPATPWSTRCARREGNRWRSIRRDQRIRSR